MGQIIVSPQDRMPGEGKYLGKLFKNPCYQAGWNKNVPFSFS